MNILEDIIYPVADEISATLESPRKLEKSPDTELLGDKSALDSLTLVALVIAVEGAVAEKTGQTIILANEKAMSRKNSPFRTMRTLADYVGELLKEAPRA